MPEYVRVTDTDTGHKRSVLASEIPHGNYRRLKESPVDANGDPLPPEFNATKPLSSTTEGQKATDNTTKE
ncbi:hypothetical protein [Nocardioides sp. REDSEA-S30_B4]|jgi:hypothetical protein|uniref:hypothetical protein n=1 Tax=Nocardioides sp. REDSEA-S30_B4 TaxID=1811552 RepID=UPI000A5CE3D3|nr:hypothetical protein [Nocardioides sp. REDSEA-S30_B4]